VLEIHGCGLSQDMCKNRPLDLQGTRGYKVLLLNEVDRLSREAQHSLRRTMEKYSATCRLVFSCCNISKVALPFCYPTRALSLPGIPLACDERARV
jgi:replication factor C subunit 3/5